MIDLDLHNPKGVHPVTLATLGALLLFLIGIFCTPIADAAAPSLPFADNYLAVFSTAVGASSLILLMLPRLVRWDWRAKCFGAPLFPFGSTALLGVVPCLGIVFYSTLPAWARLVILGTYTASIIWWCRRFVIYYRDVFAHDELRRMIYQEDGDAIYYLQRGDRILFERKRKLAQCPPNSLVVACLALGFCTFPFARYIVLLIGSPFALIFLTIAGLPLVLMCLGLATRGFLIFYYYPWRLKRQTGKDVYVLLTKVAPVPGGHS